MPSDARVESDPVAMAVEEETPDPLRKGTLHYTKSSLILLFSVLLWGDFVLSMMENVVYKILPLQLKELGASNTVMAVLAVTMGYVFNLLINPALSFQSDNLRTAWGRRLPYLIVVTPLITVLLIIMAFVPEIGHWVYGSALGHWLKVSPNTVIIGTMAVVFSLFQIFNYCLQPIYYYLFVDVVPNAYMARFMALFRVVVSIQAYIFMTFIYPHTLTHTRAIYIGLALSYFAGFMAICLWVREGQYPPPVHKKIGFDQSVKTYFRECYSHPHYVLFNLRNACAVLAQGTGIYSVFVFRDQLGISLDWIGRVNGWSSLIVILLLYPMGMICDRFSAVRVVFLLTILMGLSYLANYFFLYSLNTYIFLTLLSGTLFFLTGSAEMPFYAVILPCDRFGQFGSANQIVVSVMAIGGSFLAGRYLDWMTAGGTIVANYRYQFLWQAFFQGLAVFFMVLVYFSWKKYGGLKNYIPPEPWNNHDSAN